MQSKKKSSKMTVKKAKNSARVLPKKQKLSKNKIEKKVVNDVKSKDNKTMLIAQELKFARLLANNDKKVRDKVLKNLKKWLMMRSQSTFSFTEADFLRLWKGLFYCMWMSDKPLVQEDLAESLSKLVHCFNSMDTALLYIKCTFKSLSAEWFGIDRYRIDKFEMLVRKIVREMFVMCKKQTWNKEWVVGAGNLIQDILLDPRTCIGFNLHITDIYMEELAKIGEGKIPKNIVTEFVRPFIIHLIGMHDERQIKHVVKNIFRYLIFQSDIGMDYTEKFNAWRQAGFPCKNIDEMQRIESDNEDTGDEEIENNVKDVESLKKPLDPRAGRVDVEIPQIPFDPLEIATVLKENKFHKSSTTKTRRCITKLMNDFVRLNEGNMPFGIKEIPVQETSKINSYEAAKELLNFEKELYSDSSKTIHKKKKNGDLTEINKEFENVEELFPDQENSFADVSEHMKNIKLNLGDYSENVDNKFENTTKIKQQAKVKLSNKRKSKNLNVLETLPNKKLKKSPNKLHNPFSECIEIKNLNDLNVSTNEASTSSNWSVDIARLPSSVSNNSIIEQKETPMKSKVITENQLDKNLLKNNIPWLTPVLTRLEENKTPKSGKSILNPTPKLESAKKRVKIMLQRNTAQNTSEYIRQLRQSPAIPFDANRKPKAGVLKPSPIPSPVNPFYKRKIF